jgi:hypothetical protein
MGVSLEAVELVRKARAGRWRDHTIETIAFLILVAGLTAEIVTQVQSHNRNSLIVGLLNDEASEAERSANQARLDLAKLEAPRTLTLGQQSKIRSAIERFSGQEYVLSVAAIGEASRLLCAIDAALRSAGWERHAPWTFFTTYTDCGMADINILSSVHVRVSPEAPQKVVDAVAALTNALKNEGIDATPEQGPKSVPIPTVMDIMVGIKP